MKKHFDAQEIACQIWAHVGSPPAFPRDLALPVMEAYPVAIVELPRLSIAGISGWLSERGREVLGQKRDRPLSAGLIARGGHGLIFLDSLLAEDERRFAIAHEFAHFIVHYLGPRQAALAHFGSEILPVLDGKRLATAAERLAGVLRGLQIGTFEDYLGRGAEARPTDAIVAIEEQADLVALELLAPKKDVKRMPRSAEPTRYLIDHFGLPSWAAAEYARTMKIKAVPKKSLVRGLELVVRKKIS
ncbi:ImmA/IrrE family metallo-endopeptidase [Pseudoduganella sp. R-32]|uniref:ImmA/IrrE family metallo-endopeptidase n=1 Tax=Pseudoduganella sp. R-32 TaxID=3404061 RepID=UPI003CF58920